MKKLFLFFTLTCILVSCSRQQITGENYFPPSVQVITSVSKEEALKKAYSYYPKEVTLEYTDTSNIKPYNTSDVLVENEFYIYDVHYKDTLVSGVAVGTKEGSVWFREMNTPQSYVNEKNFPSQNKQSKAMASSNVFKISFPLENDTISMNFSNITTIPELSNKNFGTIHWQPTEQLLHINATKITGTVTDQPDGPMVFITLAFEKSKPFLKNVEFKAAPIYSNPCMVIHSQEVLQIQDERVIAIACEIHELLVQQSKNQEFSAK